MPMRIYKWIGITAAVIAGVVMTGATFEQVSRMRASHKHPAPGLLVDVGGGRRLQIDCRGSGSPTVVLESGLDIYGSLAWAAVHDSLAANTRVCAYSRAGIMWSDPARGPFDSRARAHDLHAALAASGAQPPYVLVAHSLGGPYALTFTKEYGANVRGLVFVDATHPGQFPRYEAAVGKSIMPSAKEAQLGATLAWTGLVRMLAPTETPQSWPAALSTIASQFLPQTVAGLAEETAAIPTTLAHASDARALGDRPTVVLSAGEPQSDANLQMMGLNADQGARLFAAHQALAADMARWSTRGRLEVVPKASHYIQFDRPDAVIRAVSEVVGYVIADDTGIGDRGLRGLGRRVSADRAGAP
jgi:pimeloyl-ACP methyl ester carboxylesterase